MLIYCYKIYNSEDDKEYVGSTKNKLLARMSKHKFDANRDSNKKIHIHMRGLGIDKFSIVELERREVDDRQEQLKLETEWQIKLNSVLNERRAYTSPDKKLEIARKYKEDHSDKVKEDWKKYEKNNNPMIECECGISIKKLSLTRHKKSKKHFILLNSSQSSLADSEQDKHEKDLEKWRLYRENNRDKVNESSKVYRAKNKDKISDYNKLYALKNKVIITCECGKNITARKLKQHKLTKYHLSHS